MRFDINRVALDANSPVPISHTGAVGRGVPSALSQVQPLHQRIGRINREVKGQETIGLSNRSDVVLVQGSYRTAVRLIKRFRREKDILTNLPIGASINTPWSDVLSPQAFVRCRQEYLIEQLETATKSGNESTFLDLLKEVYWDALPIVDFIKIIQLALEAAAFLAAREISIRGLEYYPDDSQIQKYARILAPPKVNSSILPMNPGIKANRSWLRINGETYRGRWVALRNGELLGSADSLESLKQEVPDTENVMFTPIY